MSFRLSQKSLDRLSGVHPDLVAVVKRALEISEVDFAVFEGVRSKTRQAQLFKEKATKTLNSRHLTGHAVDLYPVGRPTPWDKCAVVAQAMKKAANELGVPIVWGGDWRSFVDQPHYELDRRVYP